PGQRRKFRLPGLRVSPGAQSHGRVATLLHAQVEEADGVAGEAQGYLRTLSVAVRGTGGGAHQPDSAWLGEVLCRRGCEPVLRLREGLGGEEGTATLDARPETAGLRLGQVE